MQHRILDQVGGLEYAPRPARQSPVQPSVECWQVAREQSPSSFAITVARAKQQLLRVQAREGFARELARALKPLFRRGQAARWLARHGRRLNSYDSTIPENHWSPIVIGTIAPPYDGCNDSGSIRKLSGQY